MPQGRKGCEVMQAPQTHLEAVTLGIYLALTAPTDEKSQMVVGMTEELIEAVGMSEHDVDTARAIALAQFEISDATGEGEGW